ncbi:hypothetical protein PENTCL1PPCAC_20131, partial [Pristionchus entomophagus]
EVETLKNKGDKYFDSMEPAKTKYTIDYFVATEIRTLGGHVPSQVLIKWSGYPIPSWEDRIQSGIKGNAIKSCLLRCKLLDWIEIRIRTERGDAYFEMTYPNRYLKPEVGAGVGGYVEDERSLYVNDLRAREYRWNFICGRAGLPDIFIEDWTNGPPGEFKRTIKDLKDLIFTNYMETSPDVKEIIKNHKQLSEMKCDPKCTSCKRTTRGDGIKTAKYCCHMECSVDVDEQTGEFHWLDNNKEKPRPLAHQIKFECTDSCQCDKDHCKNRAVQKGRQKVLVLFREPKKGWGVRTVSEFDKDCFVTEYIGVINREGLGGKKANYDFNMAYPAPHDNGEEERRPFVISAGVKGNESRFFNHSCNPNMEAVTAVVDRYGLFYHRIAFSTIRNVLPGEELNFNYFPDKSTAESNIKRMFPNGCQCASSECSFPPKSAGKSKGERSTKRKKEKWDEGEKAKEGNGRNQMRKVERRDEKKEKEEEKEEEDVMEGRENEDPMHIDEDSLRDETENEERRKTEDKEKLRRRPMAFVREASSTSSEEESEDDPLKMRRNDGGDPSTSQDTRGNQRTRTVWSEDEEEQNGPDNELQSLIDE